MCHLIVVSFVYAWNSDASQAFDPQSESYGHGNNKTGETKKSILHPDLKTIPSVPQVQLIGNGTVYNHEGLAEARLKHPNHTTFHKTRVSPEDEAKGITRFYRWHIDAALYDLNPPRVTTLYAINVPRGSKQICRYDDGTGDELEVPLGGTAFVSGKVMFDILPAELKSLAVRSKVKYTPHPYVWMAPARAMPTGLGIETEGLELTLDKLPSWEESRIKTFPVVRLLSVFFFTRHLRGYIRLGRIQLLETCTLKSTLVVPRRSLLTLFHMALIKMELFTQTVVISPN